MLDKKKLEKIVEEVVENDDNLKQIVFDIVVKIHNMEYNKTTRIADLINYDRHKNFVEPLTQGKINYMVSKACEKMDISLQPVESGFGGLAFFYNFEKVKNCMQKSDDRTENFKLNIDEFDEKHKKQIDLLNRLQTEKLYTLNNADNHFAGNYDYNPIVWEVFGEVCANNQQKTYKDYLVEKDMQSLSKEEIVEQFLFWSRGERFCDGTIAKVIDSGDFVGLFIEFIRMTSPYNKDRVD